MQDAPEEIVESEQLGTLTFFSGAGGRTITTSFGYSMSLRDLL